MSEAESTVDIAETCPHCLIDIEGKTNKASLTTVCPNCGKVIPLCGRCVEVVGDESKLQCDDCFVCDLANVMNCIRQGKTDGDIEKVLANLTPPLTDMTTGIPECVGKATYSDYIEDIEPAEYERGKNGEPLIGDDGKFTCTREERVRFPDAVWDVKYWDCFRILKECILTANSSESDFCSIVMELRKANKS